jgi:hypothetical protein
MDLLVAAQGLVVSPINPYLVSGPNHPLAPGANVDFPAVNIKRHG